MTMIRNTFTHPVIELDGRNADTSWDNHRERGSLGGVDLAYPYGAKVHSPADGRLVFIVGNGSGGNIALIYLGDGRRIEIMHLSEVVGQPARYVKAGEVIALSGASGFGNQWHYAPHVHAHIVLANGVRANIFHSFTYAAPAAGDSITITPERHTMTIGVSTTNHGDNSYALVDGGAWVTIETESLANALSTNDSVGRFTELTVADFYKLRDACEAKAGLPVAAPPALEAKAIVDALAKLPGAIADETAKRLKA